MANKSTKSAASLSKRDTLLKMLRSNRGASIPEMQKASGWQAHSVRGFLSGTVKKRLHLPLESQISKSGDRRYSVALS